MRRFIQHLALAALCAGPLMLAATPSNAMLPAATAAVPSAWPGGETLPVERAHCRAVWHTHRRCVRWSRGQCVAWRSWRHRC
jgi:hypothetical protein